MSILANVAEIVFTGVVALVAAKGNRPFTAVMPNGAAFDPVHGAFALIEDRPGEWEIDVDGNPCSNFRYDPRTNVKYCYVPLTGDFRVDASPVPVTSNTDRVFYNRRPVSADDYGSIHWIAKLDSVWPAQPDHFRDGVLGNTRDPAVVAARIEAPAGHLSSLALVPLNGKASVWRISPRRIISRAWERAMAQEAALRAEVATDLVLLERDQNGQYSNAKIRLRKTGGNVGTPEDPFLIRLGNTPADEVLPAPDFCDKPITHICLLGDDDHCPPTCVDHHFALYYKLFTDSLENPPLPYRVEAFTPPSPVFTARRVLGGNCPPVRVEVDE